MRYRVVWSTPAMAMVPASNTVGSGKYATTAGRVRFAVGASGQITFIAPVTTPLPEGEYYLQAHIVRTSADLFGTKILLRRARRAGGAVNTVLKCATVQGGTVSNNIRASSSEAKVFAVDLDEYYYWVQLDDVAENPVTAEAVKATLGVSLVRVEVE